MRLKNSPLNYGFKSPDSLLPELWDSTSENPWKYRLSAVLAGGLFSQNTLTCRFQTRRKISPDWQLTPLIPRWTIHLPVVLSHAWVLLQPVQGFPKQMQRYTFRAIYETDSPIYMEIHAFSNHIMIQLELIRSIINPRASIIVELNWYLKTENV